MPRGKRNRVRRGREARNDENAPTAQTRAKLTADPLQAILAGQDVSLEHAADEIYRVYTAVCRAVMGKTQAFGNRIPGLGELTDEIAWAHAQTYLPWVATTKPNLVDLVLSVVVDRQDPPFGKDAIRRALGDYARRMRER